MKRFLCVSTKGGVGKSSISQQVAATYLLKREGEARLVELDDQNLDSQWLKKSKIKTTQILVDDDPKMAILDVFEAMAGKSFVLDLGNQAAEKALPAMGRSRVLRRFDLILVPVRDTGQDLINAERTVAEIRSFEPNAQIALVLNGIAVKKNRLKMLYGEIFDFAEDAKLPLLQMPFVDGYGKSRSFETTLIEIADQAEKLIDFFSEKSFDLDKAGKHRESRNCIAMTQLIDIAVEASEEIQRIHSEIDSLIIKEEPEADHG